MSEALDLGPLDAALRKLLDATSGSNLAPTVLREGEAVAERWRANVSAAGLIRTGAYRDSIRARVGSEGPGHARVLVGTDLGYPNVLEHGDEFIRGYHVAGDAFDAEQQAVIDAIGAAIVRAIE